jgi:hypothetical protein
MWWIWGHLLLVASTYMSDLPSAPAPRSKGWDAIADNLLADTCSIVRWHNVDTNKMGDLVRVSQGEEWNKQVGYGTEEAGWSGVVWSGLVW